MPKAFDACVKSGGRVRTITPKKGTYIHVCFLNGKSYHGEVKHTKGGGNKYSNALKGE